MAVKLAELSPAKPWFVYMLLCRGGCVYVGVTPDLVVRMHKHRAGTGAKFTRSHPPERFLGAKCFGSKGEALSMEYQVKRLRSAQKRALALAWTRAEVLPGLAAIRKAAAPARVRLRTGSVDQASRRRAGSFLR